jgi:hypothetical protein
MAQTISLLVTKSVLLIYLNNFVHLLHHESYPFIYDFFNEAII